MTLTSLQKSLASVGAFLALIGCCWLALHLHDKRVAENAVAQQHIAAAEARADTATREAARQRARADSFAVGEAAWHARADSFHVALTRDSAQLADLSRRIRITAPGVVEIARSGVTPAPLPTIDTVRVPPVLTNFMQLQAAQMAELQGALAVADSGWAAADSLAAARGRENAFLRDALSASEDENATLRRIKQPRFGFKSGVLVGVLGSAGLVFLFSRIN